MYALIEKTFLILATVFKKMSLYCSKVSYKYYEKIQYKKSKEWLKQDKKHVSKGE